MGGVRAWGLNWRGQLAGSVCKPWARFSPQVDNLLLVVMHSAQLVIHRKAFQQSIEGLMTLRQEQTSSQPIIAKALQQLKVFHCQVYLSYNLFISGAMPGTYWCVIT